MATPVIMPRQGLSVESCILTEWKKDIGEKVNKGDILFTYETDKATFEEEAEVEGILLKTFFDEGDEVPVLTNVCVIGEEGEDITEFNPEQDQENIAENTEVELKEERKPVKNDKDEALVETEKKAVKPVDESDIVKISPRARNLANKYNLDYRQAVATGPNNRIIERDIESLRKNGPLFTPAAMAEYQEKPTSTDVVGTGLGGRITTTDLANARQDDYKPVATIDTTEEYEDVALSNIRKVIAKSMQQSLSTTAQLTLNSSFDATDILEFRKQIKKRREELNLANITLNDMILYAVSRTLLNHNNLNAHFLEDKMRLFKNVHLGVAVDTDRGLMVPTIFNANQLTLNQISEQTKSRIEECRQGNINPDYLQGGTFTITNLGTLGIESFTPVLNPPQVGILGVNTIIQRVKDVNGEYVYYPAMGLSLTFDHRAIDGAPAARFLKELTTNLENFSILMAK